MHFVHVVSLASRCSGREREPLVHLATAAVCRAKKADVSSSSNRAEKKRDERGERSGRVSRELSGAKAVRLPEPLDIPGSTRAYLLAPGVRPSYFELHLKRPILYTYNNFRCTSLLQLFSFFFLYYIALDLWQTSQSRYVCNHVCARRYT